MSTCTDSWYAERKADMLEAKQAARLGEEAAALLQASEPAPLHREAAAAVKAPPAKKAAVRKLTPASASAKTNVPAAPAAPAVEQQAGCSSAVSGVANASTPMQLTEEQKARIERNRQQALAIRATKADGSAASCGGGGGGGGGGGKGGDKEKGQEYDMEMPVQATGEKENASADVQEGSAIAEISAQDQPEHAKAQANPKKRKVAKILNAVVGHTICKARACLNCAVCAAICAAPPKRGAHRPEPRLVEDRALSD